MLLTICVGCYALAVGFLIGYEVRIKRFEPQKPRIHLTIDAALIKDYLDAHGLIAMPKGTEFLFQAGKQ